jgi:hypothetical protein
MYTLLSLSACSKMPKACVESWENGKLAEQMGLPEEQLKEQKEFEEDVKAMNTEEATRMCKIQNSL